jgi:hypothetical protein
LFELGDSINCSADPNVSTLNPTDSSKVIKAFRTASSSSMTDTRIRSRSFCVAVAFVYALFVMPLKFTFLIGRGVLAARKQE